MQRVPAPWFQVGLLGAAISPLLRVSRNINPIPSQPLTPAQLPLLQQEAAGRVGWIRSFVPTQLSEEEATFHR